MSDKTPPWMSELKKWEQADYDGIKGPPPSWVPEPFKKKFGSARFMLFLMIYERKVEWKEIKSRFDKSAESNRHRVVLALMNDKKDYDEDLFFLVDLFKATLLGPEKGLEQLAGNDAVSGMRSRQGHKKRSKHIAKLAYQKQAMPYFENNKFNIAMTIREPALSKFSKQHYGAHTLRDWLKEIRPKEAMQVGRPKKT